MSKDATLSPEKMDALRKRFQEQSNKAQSYYTVMHQVKEVVGSDDAASAWMNAALPAFGGKTPAQLVNDGQQEQLLVYISTLKP